MALSEKDAFSFIWKIHNFSMCPHLCSDAIYSPTFVVNRIKWRLQLYPKERTDINYVSCFLFRIPSSGKEEDITVGFEIIMHSVHTKIYVCFEVEKHIFKCESDSSWGNPKLCLRKDILNTINGFLPNDVLTIECRIWGKENVPKSSFAVSGDLNLSFSDHSLKNEMLNTTARKEFLDFPDQFSYCQYMVRTYVRVGRICIIWPIARFNALRQDQRLSIPVISADTHAPSFAMTLYLNGESSDVQWVQIEIRIEESDITKIYFVRCRITAVNDSVKTQHVAEDEHFFEPTKKNDVWKFPTFLLTTTLNEEKYLDGTQGILNLRCEFEFSKKGDVFHIESSDSVPLSNRFPIPVKGEFNHVLNMCKKVYEEGKFSDITLRTGARMFKAHKIILSASSPVFTSMFETNMREHETGILDITDYDPDTVEQFLIFIYTNSLEDLQLDKAMKLYSMADKYQVLSLKLQCSNHLKSTLSISKVCEVLTFADLHQDQNLLDYVQNYIQLHSDVILRSELWKDLMKSNLSLASRVMLDLLTRKMDHLKLISD